MMTIVVYYFELPPHSLGSLYTIFLCFSPEAFNQWLLGVEIWNPQETLGPQVYSRTKETKSITEMRESDSPCLNWMALA